MVYQSLSNYLKCSLKYEEYRYDLHYPEKNLISWFFPQRILKVLRYLTKHSNDDKGNDQVIEYLPFG